MKTCSKCKIDKTEDNFTKIGKYLNSWCHECRAKSEQEKRIARGVKPKVKPKVVDSQHKECLRCKRILHVDAFTKNNRGRLGVAAYCKPCAKDYLVELKASNPKLYKRRHRKYTQKYRDNNRERWRALHRVNQFNRKNKVKVKSDGTVTDDFLKKLYNTKECCWCKKPTPKSKRTAEHVIPLDLGGMHSANNLKMACISCNSSKFNFKNI
jgi:5-methylcytosine-specific restriction endonuclease McrA